MFYNLNINKYALIKISYDPVKFIAPNKNTDVDAIFSFFPPGISTSIPLALPLFHSLSLPR